MVALCGGIGTGKTLLLQDALTRLPARTLIAKVVNSQVDDCELLQLAIRGFGCQVADDSLDGLERTFFDILASARESAHRAVLVIDEAQNLSSNALMTLGKVLTHARSVDLPLQVCLAGQPELAGLLESAPAREMRTGPFVLRRLGPLEEDETRGYVLHRLAVAGWDGQPAFTPDAFAAIHRASAGIPRKINLLCNVLLLHELVDSAVIRAKTVDAAADLLAFDSHPTESDPDRTVVAPETARNVPLLAKPIPELLAKPIPERPAKPIPERPALEPAKDPSPVVEQLMLGVMDLATGETRAKATSPVVPIVPPRPPRRTPEPVRPMGRTGAPPIVAPVVSRAASRLPIMFFAGGIGDYAKAAGLVRELLLRHEYPVNLVSAFTGASRQQARMLSDAAGKCEVIRLELDASGSLAALRGAVLKTLAEHEPCAIVVFDGSPLAFVTAKLARPRGIRVLHVGGGSRNPAATPMNPDLVQLTDALADVICARDMSAAAQLIEEGYTEDRIIRVGSFLDQPGYVGLNASASVRSLLDSWLTHSHRRVSRESEDGRAAIRVVEHLLKWLATPLRRLPPPTVPDVQEWIRAHDGFAR